MTIPTRDELIERIPGYKGWLDSDIQKIADFALAEIRRAVAEELEALRDSMSAKWELSARILIDARLAALREQPISEASMPLAGRGLERREPGSIPGAMSAGGDAGGNSGETKARAGAGAHGAEESAIDCTAPALSDADALDKAAEILDKSTRGLGGVVREVAAKLRAASAPVPVPKPVDVFEAFGAGEPELGLRATVRARDWFSPLVAALEELERVTPHNSASYVAHDALEALRQRAQEAMPERASDLAASLHEADAAHSYDLWQSELRKARGEQ